MSSTADEGEPGALERRGAADRPESLFWTRPLRRADSPMPARTVSALGRTERLRSPQCVHQLPAGVDAELAEHVAQMPLHGPPAQEEPRTDLRIRHAIAGKLCDLPLLRGQVIASLDRPLAHLLARGLKLFPCARGEPLHPDRDEHVVSDAQLLARVDPTVLAAQPLAVKQMSTGDLRT